MGFLSEFHDSKDFHGTVSRHYWVFSLVLRPMVPLIFPDEKKLRFHCEVRWKSCKIRAVFTTSLHTDARTVDRDINLLLGYPSLDLIQSGQEATTPYNMLEDPLRAVSTFVNIKTFQWTRNELTISVDSIVDRRRGWRCLTSPWR